MLPAALYIAGTKNRTLQYHNGSYAGCKPKGKKYGYSPVLKVDKPAWNL